MFDSGPVSDLVMDIRKGNIVPYLGPGVLDGVVDKIQGSAIPANSESLILAMNNGTPMAPRLMYEFPRAAMNLELKKGRKFVENFFTKTYGETQWTESPFHSWLASLKPPYVIDINRDTQFQEQYKDTPHTLIVGIARVGGTDYRFKLFSYRDGHYQQVAPEDVDSALPILFKPMGTPLPEANYVASDADYVDYITELMGGFAIPAFLKLYRRNRQYLFIGMRFQRDTERMVMSDIIYDAAPLAGYVLLPNPTEKERRFCQKKNLQLIETDWHSLLSACGAKVG